MNTPILSWLQAAEKIVGTGPYINKFIDNINCISVKKKEKIRIAFNDAFKLSKNPFDLISKEDPL